MHSLSPSHSSISLRYPLLSSRRHLTTLNTHLALLCSHSAKRGTDRNSDVVAPLVASARHEDKASHMYAPTSIFPNGHSLPHQGPGRFRMGGGSTLVASNHRPPVRSPSLSGQSASAPSPDSPSLSSTPFSLFSRPSYLSVEDQTPPLVLVWVWVRSQRSTWQGSRKNVSRQAKLGGIRRREKGRLRLCREKRSGAHDSRTHTLSIYECSSSSISIMGDVRFIPSSFVHSIMSRLIISSMKKCGCSSFCLSDLS
jgi:hypothetical protein